MVLLFALVAWVFYSRMDSIEDSLSEAKNWAEDASQQLPASLPSALSNTNDGPTTSNDTSDNTQTVYKWQDADGRWHFGDSAPANATGLQSREYSFKTPPERPQTTDQTELVNAQSANSESRNQRPEATSNTTQQPSVGSLLPTPGNVSRLMEQAQQAADAMSQHTQTLETLTGGAGTAAGSNLSNQTSTNPYRVINGR